MHDLINSDNAAMATFFSRVSDAPVWLVLIAAAAWTVVYFIFQRRLEYQLSRARAMEEKLAEPRQRLYREFEEGVLVKVMAGTFDPNEAKEFLQRWGRAAWLVASDDVISAWTRFQAGGTTNAEVLVLAARVLVAMRKDSGTPSRLSEEDALRQIIKPADWPQLHQWLKQTRVPTASSIR